jgi:hypothetical protein
VKVSAAALKEDTSSITPVIENIPVTKPTTLTLRHTYKEGESNSGCTGQAPSIHQLVFFERLSFGAVFVH